MNKSDENIESKTDLELALNYSGHCTRKDSDDDSCAGANAASRVDMSFATNNPVSELVWSPIKGPRVKCADSSFPDKKTSLFWDVGPSNAFPPLRGMIGVMFNPDKLIDDDNSPHHNNGTGCICEGQETDTTIGFSISHANQKDHNLNSSGKDIPVQAEVINSGVPEKNEPLFTAPGHVDIKTPDNLFLEAEETSTDLPRNEPCDGDIGSRNMILEADNTVACEIQHAFGHEASSTPVTSSGRLVRQKEFTAENELQTVDDGISMAAVGKIAISLSSPGNEKKCQGNELVLQCHKNSQPTCCPNSSRTHRYLEKCKGKSLSDGGERISNEDDDSHESVESCNSAGQFSTCKRQWNFKQQNESKRVKGPLQQTLDSPPYIRRDSSFMNWISNITKGFSQLGQDKVTPALTFGDSYNDVEMLDQKLVKSSKDQDPGFRIGGFQSIFQSICSSGTKNTETRKLCVNQQLEDHEMNVALVNKVTSNTPMPIAYCPEGGSYHKQGVHSSEIFEGSPCQNEVLPLSEAEVLRKFVTDHVKMRLDALKHNEPSNLKDDPSRANMTCFFCGVTGHQVHNCRETSGNGVKDPPRDMNPYEKLEECSCMLAEHAEVNPRPSEYHEVFSSEKHANAGNQDNALHIVSEERNCQAPTAHDDEQRLKERIHSVKKSNRLLNEEKLGSKSSIQYKLEENARNPSCNTDEQQVSNAPKGIFEAIKTLQLSRSDILKWIGSPTSASHLDGFFLRLRLGKLEECLGETGYHVAYIIGSHRQSLVQNAKTSVSVNVKGVECLVESQFISNHHFLEDEVMAWLSTSSKGGDNWLPSEKDLIERIKKKESLGF